MNQILNLFKKVPLVSPIMYIASSISVWLDWLILDLFGVNVYSSLWEDKEALARVIILGLTLIGAVVTMSRLLSKDSKKLFDSVSLIVALFALLVALIYFFDTQSDASKQGFDIDPGFGFILTVMLMLVIISASIVNLTSPFKFKRNR